MARTKYIFELSDIYLQLKTHIILFLLSFIFLLARSTTFSLIVCVFVHSFSVFQEYLLSEARSFCYRRQRVQGPGGGRGGRDEVIPKK